MESGDSLSQWLNSDFFIVFVVLLLVLLLVVFAVCWLLRRHHTQRPSERMTEIEIIPVGVTDTRNPSRFTLKVVTEQTHATELLEMLTQRRFSVEAPDCHSSPSASAGIDDDDSDQEYIEALQNISF